MRRRAYLGFMAAALAWPITCGVRASIEATTHRMDVVRKVSKRSQ